LRSGYAGHERSRLWTSQQKFVRDTSHLQWAPSRIRADRVEGFSVVRETIGKRDTVYWTIPGFDERVMQDWAVRAGNEYCYEVTMYAGGKRMGERIAAGVVTVGLGIGDLGAARPARDEAVREMVPGGAGVQGGPHHREGR
jgi:hypothetical protein